jgi:hypothetical protein
MSRHYGVLRRFSIDFTRAMTPVVAWVWCLVISPDMLAQNTNASPNYTLRGKITEADSREAVIGANVYCPTQSVGATTNAFGEYVLILPKGKHTIQISSIEYEGIAAEITLVRDTLITHVLDHKINALEEVTITGEADRINSLRLGQNTLNLTTLKKIPPLLGEMDLIRSLLLMPGVSTVGEGATGFNVRGGSVDQNLVLMDDAPIFNTSHLFGFLTAFNSNAVLNADLYKGGIPANYGGRVASVLDVKLKQGNANRISGQAGIGLMAGNLTVEGPIIPQRTTFLLAGRSSYSDWLLRTVPEDNIADSKASFYDGTLKLSHQINNRNIISFTGYTSHDSFKFPGDTTYAWGTNNLTLKLGSTINPKMFLTSTLVSSNYVYKVLGRQQTNEFDWKASIQYQAAKGDLNIALNQKNKADIGAGVELYGISLGDLKPKGGSNVNAFTQDKEHGMITFGYVSHQGDVSDRFSFRAGFRFSMYRLYGPGSVNHYEEGIPMSAGSFIETETFGSGATIKKYYGYEPRISARFSLTPSSSLKVSLDQTVQFLHLISNTSAISPIDLWKLADPYLKPQIGKQIALGYFKKTRHQNATLSVEAFYKRMENMVDYKDGAELLLNDQLEAALLQGEGRSYGMEWMIEKNRGKFTGWLAYTLSRTERKVEGSFPETSINKGEYYPANYDKPHSLSITGSYQKSTRVSLGFNFVFASGRPVTYPTSSYAYGGIRVVNFEYRNNERSPAYHRLDISLEVKSKEKPDRRWNSSWVLSIYNVYARKNPYSIFFRSEYNVLAQSYRLAVIGTVVPSLSYTINF